MKIAKAHKPKQSRVVQNKSLTSVQQYKRDASVNTIFFGAEHDTLKIRGKDWNRCKKQGIIIPPFCMPPKGTPTSGRAPWAGILKDAETGFNATRLHVINSNFGGLGGNKQGNLHPGSQRLNLLHYRAAESKFMQLIDNEQLDGCHLLYICEFDWDSVPDNNKMIHDPIITCKIMAYADDKSDGMQITINGGSGMCLTSDGQFTHHNDDDLDSDDLD